MPNRPDIDLFAVQAACTLRDYLSPEAFDAKIFSFADEIRQRRGDSSTPAVVVFPENIGLFLAGQGAGNEILACRTSDDAFKLLGRRFLKDVLWAMVRYRVTDPKAAFWLARASAVRDTMIRSFSRFALETRSWVVAGSASLPHNKFGLVLRPFAAANGRVYNMSLTFGPDGRLLAETPKLNLVPELEDTIGLSRGNPTDVTGVDVAGARLATAICYDGFRCAHTQNEPDFTPLIPLLDRMGVDIVAQPSANPWPWEAPWHFALEGDTRLRREQWSGEGSFSVLPNMSRVAWVVNPQLAGDLLDLHFEGRSAIYARQGREASVLAEAATIDRDEVVHARVSLAAPAVNS